MVSREGYVCFKMRDTKACVFDGGNDPVEEKSVMQQREAIWSLGTQMDMGYSADLCEKAESMDPEADQKSW